MNITINTIKGDKDINIEWSSEYKGKWEWNIVAEVSYEVGNTIYQTQLRHHTTNAQFIYRISDMIQLGKLSEDIEDEYQFAFFFRFENAIKEFVCRYE